MADIPSNGPLVTDLAEAMAAFHDAIQKLGLSQQVTTFTQSDFGRTYVPKSLLAGGTVAIAVAVTVAILRATRDSD